MKKITLILILSLCYLFCCNAQDLQSSYIFNTNYTDTITKLNYKKGYKIKVIDIKPALDGNEKKDSIIFTVNRFKIDTSNENKKGIKLNTLFYETENNSSIQHIMVREVFNKYTDPIYSCFRGVRAGFYTIPFKIRIDNFDFEQNINFGMNIGFQFRFNKKIEDSWLYEPSIGIGISSINLNSKNSNVSEERTASAFSSSIGLILHFDKNINIGLFSGMDFLGNSDIEADWKYNKKIWFGIGVNIGFSLSESKGESSNNKPE
ncbi:hypothetical protein [Aquimarina muelleri]|uniref:Outer membrane protein beta-barrel domain-containing protein n=1 Tax=Aquimarina muelleri TaxID=279356 RepID=A0A918JVI1_9FLAO|nr:hypothetical protein [Aquimarina muelleri]MCX2761162.1 hypothetical protein [Aquimarina muelleri]GGX08754.1 hypothetical protein GCM10007384_08140 [Aquimarina muelleri]